MNPLITRRKFLRGTASGALAAPFVTSGLRAVSANGKLQHASVGASGMAGADMESLGRHPAFQLVAVADVDRRNLDSLKSKLKDRFPGLRVYQDWREMLERRQTKSTR